MKKLAIAGASLALAAMPVVGVFAAATSSSFTDTLTVDVKGGCTLTNSRDASTPGSYTHGDRTFTANAQPGNVVYLNADSTGAPLSTPEQGTVAIACNSSDSSKSWTVAVDVEGLSTSGQSPVTISGGNQTTGATSGWAIKSNASLSSGSFTADVASSYWAAADETTFLQATADKTATFNPSYQVYVAPGQTPGVYTGTATYSITLPQS